LKIYTANLLFKLSTQKTDSSYYLEKAPLDINKSYIESILLNLLTNSIKYKSENRTLKNSGIYHQKGELHHVDLSRFWYRIDLKQKTDWLLPKVPQPP
jgi:hypothetical protein